MTWCWPLKDVQPLFPDKPGTWGHSRRYNSYHTGVDLYCNLGTEVVSVEDGVVVAVEWFTGQYVKDATDIPSTWWNDTHVVIVRGASGFVAYGEVHPQVSVGQLVVAGQVIATIQQAVLRKFKGRPMVMLHLELYDQMLQDPTSLEPSHTTWWGLGEEKPAHLLDPTPFLIRCAPQASTFDLDTYDQTSYRIL